MTDEDAKTTFKRLKNIQDEKNKVPETYLTLNHYQLEELEKIINENYIPKDKIRELYNEYKGTGYFEVEQILKELLGDECDE